MQFLDGVFPVSVAGGPFPWMSFVLLDHLNSAHLLLTVVYVQIQIVSSSSRASLRARPS